jgi:transposase-like protein
MAGGVVQAPVGMLTRPEGPGRWCYLYRAVDRHRKLIDTMLSKQRDLRAAKAFFQWARSTTGFRPVRVTTDGHGSYPKAIRAVLGQDPQAPDQCLSGQPA